MNNRGQANDVSVIQKGREKTLVELHNTWK